MELGRAVGYIFEDKNWVSKLIPLMLVGVASLIPIFGLIATALGLGYLLHLARNVREGLPRPLPKWDDWQVKLGDGGQILAAVIIYNLPLLVMFGCSYTLIVGIGSGYLGGAISLFAICCTAPMLLFYAVFAYSLLGIGIAEVIETDEFNRLYRFAHLWDVFRSNNQVVFQWALYTTIMNLLLSLLNLIPFFGTIAYLMIAYPIQGHLLGQFAHRLSLTSRPKKKANAGR